ncbi:MAG TPA: methyltransferase domain-containing protein [Steroidobacteraceae bacterium]|nr:methyltransferase domain-containing protein [Steroidobacteraceae bacterium]
MSDFLSALYQWQAGRLGTALIQAEARLLADTFDDVFGLELVQLGTWGVGRELLAHARIWRQSVVADAEAPVAANIVASLAHLPIVSGSVDAALLPHTLELAADPYAVLREADRVLAAEGQLIVLGFRPGSFWGLAAAASRSGFPPGLRRTLSAARVRDWLRLLSYEIVSVRPYLFHLPRAPRGSLDSALPSMLRRGWFYPWPAGAYVIKARKRVYTLTPIRPRLREWRTVIGGLVGPRV